MPMIKKLYHGSSNIIEKPLFGYGKPYNDYGLGFYCTDSLEMAMENCRYFDLRRWGIASETLSAYFANEVNDVYSCADKNGTPLEGATLDADGNAVPQTYATYYKDARYTTDKNEYFPIPYNQMFYMPGLYEQNRNYE